MVTQRNICHFLRSANAIYGFAAEDVVFQGASTAFFSICRWKKSGCPISSARPLFVADAQIIAESDRLADLPRRSIGMTVIDTVPTLLAMIGQDVPSLRLILLGGEALPPALAARWIKPGRRLFNTYGPTEATVVATAEEVMAGEPITIGKPIPNYSCWILGEDMSPVPPGRQGEFLIGGPGIVQGYLLAGRI